MNSYYYHILLFLNFIWELKFEKLLIFRKFLLEKFFFKPQIPQIDFIEYLNNRFGFDIPPVKLGTFEKKINNSIYLNLKEKFHWVN